MEQRSYSFPSEAAQYTEWAQQEIQRFPFYEEQVTPTFGIRWYEIAPQRNTIEGQEPHAVLFCAPHADDLEIAAAVTISHHVQKGDHVSELLFTLGSSGRFSRGFDEKTTSVVRLAEALKGAEVIGLQRMGVIQDTTKDQQGIDEWFTIPDTPELRELGVALARKYNPHIIYSPHPDKEVDTHPDHKVVANVAEWAYKWGTENAFYQHRFEGQATNLFSWRRYAVWTGEHGLAPNLYTRYAPEGRFSQQKREAISLFQSQGGTIYAETALSKDKYIGGMMYVGDSEMWAVETFNELKPGTVVTPSWQDK